MKNSTLLRLFFISIGLPLTCAASSSSSPSTSSASSTFISRLRAKFRSKLSSLLVDTTNSAPVVQLKDQGILVQRVPEEIQVSEKDEQTKKFEELISKGQYKEITELGEKMSDKELLKCLCQGVTTLDHFKGLYGYLKQSKLVPSFLAHGNMVVVREVIFKTDILEIEGPFGECDSIYDAIALSLNEDRHDRAAGLFEAAKERPKWKNRFDWFARGFFERHVPEKDGMPLKRFLTLHGEDFSKKHPVIFMTICQELVWKLERQLDSLASQKLLTDLVGQPSLLTPVVFVVGFLCFAGDTGRAAFITYGYREAIEEGLKQKYNDGGRWLWAVMVHEYPNQFSGAYPDTDEARAIALKGFPTKQDREEAWAKENAPILLRHLETLATELPLHKVLLPIIAGYAITWIDV